MKAWLRRQRPLLIVYYIVQHCWAHKNALDKVRNRKPESAVSTLPPQPKVQSATRRWEDTCPKAVTCLHDDDLLTCLR